MWTSTLDLDPKKVFLTQIVGRFYHDIYFSSYSPLQVQNLPRQSLPDNRWVRVRNRLAGIGGNDLQLLYQDRDMRASTAAAPRKKHFYPGQEVVGEVIEVGNAVQNLGVGERVVRRNGPNCITAGLKSLCPYCAAGDYNLCEQAALIPVQAIGGGWSEEMLLHEQQLFRVPSSLSDAQAVMIEPTAIALHAILRHIPQAGQRVLIIGAGTIGLLTQQLLHMLVPQTEIHMMARHSFQVEQATRLGAAQIIYPQDAYTGIQKATRARLAQGLLGNQMLFGGYDVIYDTIGQRKTVHHALRWTRARGTIVLVGKNAQLINIDLSPLWYQEIDLRGSTAHGMENWPLGSTQRVSTFEIVADLMAQGRITPEQLITHHFALNNYKNALLTATNKNDSRAIKVVFDYSLLPASVVPNVRASAPKRNRMTTDPTRYTDQHRESAEQTIQSTPQPDENEAIPEEARAHADLSRVAPVPKIQNTPPVSQQSSQNWAAMAMKRRDEGGDNEDTATALPVISARMPARTIEVDSTSDVPQMSPIPQSHMGQLPSIPHSSLSEEPIDGSSHRQLDTAIDIEDEPQKGTNRDKALETGPVAITSVPANEVSVQTDVATDREQDLNQDQSGYQDEQEMVDEDDGQPQEATMSWRPPQNQSRPRKKKGGR
jgi:2-desacetyl-2-hydroxyethyl bacteriochlorophyllide A dehydrogenase